jgi:hypothetical protein
MISRIDLVLAIKQPTLGFTVTLNNGYELDHT